MAAEEKKKDSGAALAVGVGALAALGIGVVVAVAATAKPAPGPSPALKCTRTCSRTTPIKCVQECEVPGEHDDFTLDFGGEVRIDPVDAADVQVTLTNRGILSGIVRKFGNLTFEWLDRLGNVVQSGQCCINQAANKVCVCAVPAPTGGQKVKFLKLFSWAADCPLLTPGCLTEQAVIADIHLTATFTL